MEYVVPLREHSFLSVVPLGERFSLLSGLSPQMFIEDISIQGDPPIRRRLARHGETTLLHNSGVSRRRRDNRGHAQAPEKKEFVLGFPCAHRVLQRDWNQREITRRADRGESLLIPGIQMDAVKDFRSLVFGPPLSKLTVQILPVAQVSDHVDCDLAFPAKFEQDTSNFRQKPHVSGQAFPDKTKDLTCGIVFLAAADAASLKI
jgi:hypothetical protein